MGAEKFDGLQKVPYKEARAKIKTGDLLLCGGNYLLSKLIKQFSNSPISHVGLVFTWNNRVLVLESVEDDGVRAVPLSQYVYDYENQEKPYDGTLYIARHETIDSPGFDHGQINGMLGKAADLLNKRFDKSEMTNIISRLVLGIKNHVDNDEYICSEFVDVCFKEIGIVFQRDAGGFIYPGHIASDQRVKPLFQITQ